MRMIRFLTLASAMVCCVGVASAQTVDFESPYMLGDIDGQQGWEVFELTGAANAEIIVDPDDGSNQLLRVRNHDGAGAEGGVRLRYNLPATLQGPAILTFTYDLEFVETQGATTLLPRVRDVTAGNFAPVRTLHYAGGAGDAAHQGYSSRTPDGLNGAWELDLQPTVPLGGPRIRTSWVYYISGSTLGSHLMYVNVDGTDYLRRNMYTLADDPFVNAEAIEFTLGEGGQSTWYIDNIEISAVAATAPIADPNGPYSADGGPEGALVDLDGSASTDATYFEWTTPDINPNAAQTILSEGATPVQSVLFGSGTTTGVLLNVYNDLGVYHSAATLVEVSDYDAGFGYVNEFDNLNGCMSDFPLELWTADGETGASCVVDGVGGGQHGVLQVAMPYVVNVAAGDMSITLRAQSEGGAPLTDAGTWVRFFDSADRQGAYFIQILDGGAGSWNTFEFNLAIPDYLPDTGWDPTDIVRIEFGNYNWDPAQQPYRWAIDRIEITEPVGIPPVAIAPDDFTVDPAAPVTLTDNGSYDPNGTVERYIWRVGNSIIADTDQPTVDVILPAGETTAVSLQVQDNDGVYSALDFVNITVAACTTVPDGYANDFTDLVGLGGDFPIYTDGQSAYMDIPGISGYEGFDLNALCPFNGTDGTWEITLMVDDPSGELANPITWWLRMFSAEGQGNYAVQVPTDGNWYTFTICVEEPDEWWDDYNPGAIERFRLEAVDWGHENVNFTIGIDDISITLPEVLPVADAGPDQEISDGVCGPNSVILDGTASTDAVTYTWYQLGQEVGTGAVVQLDTVPPGNHIFTLVVTDAGGCAKDSDSVAVNIYNDGLGIPLEPPVDIPMDAQINNGLGDVIYTPTGDDLNAFWAAGDFTDNYIGEDPGGNSIDHTIALIIPGGGWYYGPQIDLLAACYGAVDMSGDGAQVEFEAAYVFPPPPGEDHPIGLTLFDAYGNRRFFGMYQNADTWESRLHTMDVYDTNVDFSDEAFDPSLVVKAQFWGTNWNGTGQSYLQLRNFLMTPGTSPLCAGDMDCDGDIDFDDIAPFVAAIGADPDTWEQQFNCLWLNGDTDGDLDVDFDDIAPFVSLIGTQCD